MSDISMDHAFPRRAPGQREFSRRLIREEAKHAILIDVDDDSYEQLEQVVIIDVPKVKKRRNPRNLGKESCSYANIIHIDDDDNDGDDDENEDDNYHPTPAKNIGTSSTVESSQLGKNSGGSSDSASGKSQFVKDNVTPVRLSKCKRTYSANASVGGLHGLDFGLGSIPSDLDFCEIVEDSSGKTQQKWTKGFSRSTCIDNGQSEFRVSGADRADDYRSAGGEDQFFNIHKTTSNEEPCMPGDVLPTGVSTDVYESTGGLGTLDRVTPTNSDVEPCGVAQGPGQSEFRPFQSTTDDDEMLEASNFHENEHEENVASLFNSKQMNDDTGKTQILTEDALASEEDCVFHEREKMKETDEYKMAMEEEWASRKEALQAQAQEAKQLRLLAKRRKAETVRLMDMERRQKERLEEIRNSQKQEEQTLNLRDEIRAEVQKELSKLEITCKKNLAFLLHELGISVGGWPTPSPQQVQISYKKALLAFHPDRSSRLEIRQQVEAEEKFKLINRLKGSISS